MKKKKELPKKLKLHKTFITSLSQEESRKILGGWTTSFTYCTGWTCCGSGNGTLNTNGVGCNC